MDSPLILNLQHLNFRLDDLKKNLESWEAYENQRNKLDGQINEAEVEFKATVRVYNLEAGPKDHTERLATASKMRKLIEDTYGVIHLEFCWIL